MLLGSVIIPERIYETADKKKLVVGENNVEAAFVRFRKDEEVARTVFERYENGIEVLNMIEGTTKLDEFQDKDNSFSPDETVTKEGVPGENKMIPRPTRKGQPKPSGEVHTK